MYEGGNKKKGKDEGGFLEMIGLGNKRNSIVEDNAGVEWHLFNKQQKKERIRELWARARKYTNKIRFVARLQKIQQINLQEMMLDDITEQNDDETLTLESTPKLKWYMLDVERTPVKVWEFLITLLILYSLYITPFIIVFECVYSCFLCEQICPVSGSSVDVKCVEKYNHDCVDDSYQKGLQ